MPTQVYQVLVAVCLAAVPITAVILGTQITGVTVRAVRAGQQWVAFKGALGLIGLGGSIAIVAVAWFLYAVSHGAKSVATDVRMLAYTCAPYYLIAAGLSRLVGHWRRVLARAAKAAKAEQSA